MCTCGEAAVTLLQICSQDSEFSCFIVTVVSRIIVLVWRRTILPHSSHSCQIFSPGTPKSQCTGAYHLLISTKPKVRLRLVGMSLHLPVCDHKPNLNFDLIMALKKLRDHPRYYNSSSGWSLMPEQNVMAVCPIVAQIFQAGPKWRTKAFFISRVMLLL